MLTKFKTTLAAIALIALPMMATAAPMQLNEGASTLIELDNTYSYSNTALTGAGSLTFDLTATPPSQLELKTRFSVLEFTGTFVGLVIQLTTGEGVEFATLTNTLGDVSEFALNTIFNNDRNFTQTLNISWTDVMTGDSAQAGILIQSTPSAVPVPAAGLLLLSALGGVAALRRRRKAVEA